MIFIPCLRSAQMMSDTAMCWEAEAELAWKSSSSSAISAISSSAHGTRPRSEIAVGAELGWQSGKAEQRAQLSSVPTA